MFVLTVEDRALEKLFEVLDGGACHVWLVICEVCVDQRSWPRS